MSRAVMTARGTLVLVGVLVSLAGYLWVAEVGRRTPLRASAPVEPAPLLAVPPAAVARVEVEEGTVRLVAIRRGGGWSDAEGRPWPRDAVADLLESLGTIRPVMTVDPDPTDPADYGFGPDAVRIRLLAPDGRPLLALDVGERNPAWTGLYARRTGSREVMLVGALLHWELEKLQAKAPEP
ncbi:MAG TPA: DUF4340 domain-containing protein [Candidatus Binatus sp.]|jgi:Domain of unknown function (DUF4340)|nr:DUF4340 domain-containing protein [Candidatus Binatus sp.]